jgi:mannose-6-phosphate isomerase-like protein (cupin superfamily)
VRRRVRGRYAVVDIETISLADLFADKAPEWPTVLRAADRPQLDASEGVRKYALTRPPLNHVEVYVATFAPGTSTGDTAHAHGDSTEVFVVIAGSIELELGGAIHQMRSGDSIEYQTSLPHKVINTGTREAEVIWITSPPTSVIGENPHAQ